MKKLIAFVLIFAAFNTNAQLPTGSIAPDFTLTDLNGTSHNLYTYLDQGKVVYLEMFACHCPGCWAFHQSGKLESLNQMYGPNGTDQIRVLALEHDEYNADAFHGLGGYTQGDWVTGTSYPMFDVEGTDRSVFDDYDLVYYPILYKICPDKIVEIVSVSTTVADMYQKADDCPGTLGIQDVDRGNIYFDQASNVLIVEGYEWVENLEIVNMQGQVLISIPTNSSKKIQLPHLNDGVYLVQITGNNKASNERIFIH